MYLRLYGLVLNGSVNGTSVFAASAANALISVDNVLAVALRDAAGGASISTSATRDASVSNLECHYWIPP